MTEISTPEAPPSPGPPEHAYRWRGCLAALVALAVIVGGSYFVFSKGVQFVQDHFGSSPSDYAGAGSGSVSVTIPHGSSGAQIASLLEQKGVVASAGAFVEAVAANSHGDSIQSGTYSLRRHMSAHAALVLLLKGPGGNGIPVTIPEGLTAAQVAQTVAKATSISKADLTAALHKPSALGLPGYAHHQVEGYLYPATYLVPRQATATQVLTMMVDKFLQVAKDDDLVGKAHQLGISPHDIVTIASLVQAEARRTQDFGKVARVIENRDKIGMALQLDSTVHYAAGLTGNGDVYTTQEQRNLDSPYNTYKYPGLPPGAIGSPGATAFQAALQPPSGKWLYFVTVNLKTGKTLFTASYIQHLANVQKARQYCLTSKLC